MEYTIRKIITQERSVAETAYKNCSSDMLDFHLISGDFYKWDGNSLLFKDCVHVMDFEQTTALFPPFAEIQYKSREKLPYFTDGLEVLTEAWKRGEKIGVMGGPCLFGVHEVGVTVQLKNGSQHVFDYATGKGYLNNDISETDNLTDYLSQYGTEVECITFQNKKTGLTPQEYFNLRYPFEIAKAIDGALVIPIPDMSYRKYLVAVLEFVPEHIRLQTLKEFDLITLQIKAFYIEVIDKLQQQFQIKPFCCVHSENQEALKIWYEKRIPYIEQGKMRHHLTRLPGKLESIKDYISTPALPFYLFDSKFVLEVDSMTEADSYRKCRKAHKKAFCMASIMLPELLSGDNTNPFYDTTIKWKAFGDYTELVNTYLKRRNIT